MPVRTRIAIVGLRDKKCHRLPCADEAPRDRVGRILGYDDLRLLAEVGISAEPAHQLLRDRLDERAAVCAAVRDGLKPRFAFDKSSAPRVLLRRARCGHYRLR